MSSISLVALSEKGWEVKEHELPLSPGGSCAVRIAGLPGAEFIHLELRRSGKVQSRFQVACHSVDPVDLVVELGEGEEGELRVRTELRTVLQLPPDDEYAPADPIRPEAEAPIDLAILLDATARHFEVPPPVEERDEDDDGSSESESRKIRRPVAFYLLKHPEARKRLVDDLVRFAHALCDGHDARTTVVAFGDQEMPREVPEDLRPKEPVVHSPFPGELRALTDDELEAALLGIPATSGGDFVDELAEGLYECGELPWRAEARKLVLVVGDSPGHSTLHPALQQGDLHARERDVDDEALLLHQKQVEIATLYLEPPAEVRDPPIAARIALLDHARAQYQRLASVRWFAFRSGHFDPVEEAGAVRAEMGPVGRGSAVGRLLQVAPGRTGGGAQPTGDV